MIEKYRKSMKIMQKNDLILRSTPRLIQWKVDFRQTQRLIGVKLGMVRAKLSQATHARAKSRDWAIQLQRQILSKEQTLLGRIRDVLGNPCFTWLKKMVHAGRFPYVDDIRHTYDNNVYIYNIAMENGPFIEDFWWCPS